jgi:outer membrane lipoprotein LolB
MMHLNLSRPLLNLLMVITLLSGCAHQAKVTPPVISQDWPKHQTQVKAISEWQAIGKLGAKVPNDSLSANLIWQHHGKDFQIDLSGPLGAGHITITGKPGEVNFNEGGKSPQTAKTAEELILKNTGWRIPVTQLAYWVRGLPEPTTAITHYQANNIGLLGELEQLGWKVHYLDYANAQNAKGELIPMPSRITAEFNDIRLTVIIREWKLDAARE